MTLKNSSRKQGLVPCAITKVKKLSNLLKGTRIVDFSCLLIAVVLIMESAPIIQKALESKHFGYQVTESSYQKFQPVPVVDISRTFCETDSCYLDNGVTVCTFSQKHFFNNEHVK